jgi:hypothetical protein
MRFLPLAPILIAVLAGGGGCATATPSAAARRGAAAERLYVLDCGEGLAGDISRWSPGVNEGKSMPFVDTCYLIQHAQGGCCGTPACRMRSPPCRTG